MATVAEARPRNNLLGEWLAFALQAVIAVSFEVGDDLARGLVSQHGTIQGVENARRVVGFEAAHGLWIEPAWQLFFQQTHRILAFTITWPEMVRFVNGIYVFGHLFITLGVALWVFFYHRVVFARLRNIVMLTNALALLAYETFPVAPPRLTTGLTFDHHSFSFQDTVFGIVSAGGKMIGTQSGFNEFSAMPSVHMAWAIIVGAAVLYLARSPIVKALGLLYPLLMLLAIVVTGNHYLLDAAGAVLVVLAATAIQFSFERWRQGWAARRPRAAVT